MQWSATVIIALVHLGLGSDEGLHYLQVFTEAISQWSLTTVMTLLLFTSALAAMRVFHYLQVPIREAMYSGVQPSSSLLFTSALAAMRVFTISRCPFMGGPVQWSPTVSIALVHLGLGSHEGLHYLQVPILGGHVQWSLTVSSLLFTSALAAMRVFTISRCPFEEAMYWSLTVISALVHLGLGSHEGLHYLQVPISGGPVQWSLPSACSCSPRPWQPRGPSLSPGALYKEAHVQWSLTVIIALVHLGLRSHEGLHYLQVPILGGPVQWSNRHYWLLFTSAFAAKRAFTTSRCPFSTGGPVQWSQPIIIGSCSPRPSQP